MSKRNFKALKVMSTAAVTSLLFSSFTVLAETNNTSSQSDNQTIAAKDLSTDQENVTEQQEKQGHYQYSPNDSVRVIVEMTGDPVQSGKGNEAEKEKLKQSQQSLIQEMKKTKKMNIKERHHFVTGINGFSLDTEYKNIKEIQKLPGVASVQIAQVYQPAANPGASMVQAQKVWEDLGYHGEGMLVAVVDTGVDYTHQDLTLSDHGKEKAKYNSTNIQAKFDETAVNERWYSDKVPTGYDWADNDQDVFPYASPHGMHVTGTIGANGADEVDGVKGIAPDVQILAEKVFSDYSSGAYADDIVAGINHAVEMNADVINLSLGTDGSFVTEDDPIQKAIHNATEKGVLVVAAAGNAYYSSKSGSTKYTSLPYAQDPDIGVVGAPGSSPFALQVASYEGDQVHMDTLTLSGGKTLIYKRISGARMADVLPQNQEMELVYVGKGNTQDYAGKDVTGKIVVAEQQYVGGEAYIQSPAQQKGAKGLIVVPLATQGDYASLALSPSYPISGLSIGVADGKDLIDRLKQSEKITARVGKGTWIDNKNKEKMSEFSSLGAPHTLDFKPEISAPGGKIYSTVTNNKYDTYSGTSMASPHVAGGAALVLQSLYEKGLKHSENAALKAKLALMNTSNILMDPRTNGEVPYAPRVQGSGFMQIKNAINTPVIVSRKDTPLEQAGAVALKEIGKNTSFKLNVEAFDTPKGKNNSADIEYNVYVDLLKDKTETKQGDFDKDGTMDSRDYLTLTSERIDGATITVNDNKVTDKTGSLLKIKPGQSKMLTVNVSLPDSIKKDSFVEGFVRLVPVEKDKDKAVPLSIPYMGFYGKWDEPRNIDAPAWDKDAFLQETALFPYWGPKNWLGRPTDIPIGYDKTTKTFKEERMADSPYAANQGVYSIFTALRNLKQVHMYVEDSAGKLVRELGDYSEITGSPYSFRKNIMSTSDFWYPGYGWDLKTADGKYASDGKYQFVIESTLAYDGARPQKMKMPINVDSVAPKAENIQINKTPDNKYQITWDMKDNDGGSGLTKSYAYIDGVYKSISPTQSSLIVNSEPKSIIFMLFDWAGNVSHEIIGDRSNLKEELLLSILDVWARPITPEEPGHILGVGVKKLNWKFTIEDPDGKVVDTWTEKNTENAYKVWAPTPDMPAGKYKVTCEMEDETGLKINAKVRYMTVVKP